MKIRKIYESISKNPLKEYDDKRTDFNIFKTRILNLVYEYLNIYEKEMRIGYSYYGSTINDCYLANKRLCVAVDDDAPDFVLSEEDTEDLIEFIKEPKLYKNVKKYNL